MKKLVSIITPAYNAELFIRDTIESVLAQTYSHWEMIIVDDGSTDGTSGIVESYARRDKRIRLVSLGKNMGVASARNRAMACAQGKVIAFLDSDDQWRKSKLERQMDFMDKGGYSFTFTGYECIDEAGRPMSCRIIVPAVLDYERLLHGNSIGCLTVMLDSSILTSVQTKNIAYEDYAMWLDVLKLGHKAYGLNEKLALYRIRKASQSSNKWAALPKTWNIYKNDQQLSFVKSLRCLLAHIFKAVIKYI